ncbi:MAG: site-2 protease family protein [Methanomassiliicoccaceae archaeon]|nr:site-2 protease family protein [Methanomassiliicoccaceae archaeon]
MQDGTSGLRRINPNYGKPKGKISFSKTEVIHITIAIVVLSIAFTIMMTRRFTQGVDTISEILMLVGISFLLVVCSFLLHEFGHKFVAQRYHAWSEFRMYPYGLLMALLFSLMGFLFAAPGAVYIKGEIDKDSYGRISLAGPAVNFVIAAIAIPIAYMLEPETMLRFLFQMLAWLNAFLGLFNMIPVLPFDGSKIVKWNLKIYVMTVLIGVAELLIIVKFLFGWF